MEESVEDLMAEIRGRVEALEGSLPRRVDPMAVSPTAKLPFKALSYREALIWRMVELSRTAFTSFETDKLAAAILLTRAAVETSAASSEDPPRCIIQVIRTVIQRPTSQVIN